MTRLQSSARQAALWFTLAIAWAAACSALFWYFDLSH